MDERAEVADFGHVVLNLEQKEAVGDRCREIIIFSSYLLLFYFVVFRQYFYRRFGMVVSFDVDRQKTHLEKEAIL